MFMRRWALSGPRHQRRADSPARDKLVKSKKSTVTVAVASAESHAYLTSIVKDRNSRPEVLDIYLSFLISMFISVILIDAHFCILIFQTGRERVLTGCGPESDIT